MSAATTVSVGVLLGAALLGGCAIEDEPSAGEPAPMPAAQPSGGGTMLATAFPITSVLRATSAALPADAAIGTLPMEAGWQPGNRLDVPVERGGEVGSVTVTVTDACEASSALLDAGEADAIAEAVCRTWEAEGRLPIVVPDPDAPLEMNPEDAAR